LRLSIGVPDGGLSHRHRGRCCAYFQENIMRSWVLALPLACLPYAAMAGSVHVLKVINDTRSRIVSFTIAPAGSRQGTEVDFADRIFDDGTAMMFTLHDDSGCLHDFRTLLSDGEVITARHFNVCMKHAYRPGLGFSGRWRWP
jgi:hypothetical protein